MDPPRSRCRAAAARYLTAGSATRRRRRSAWGRRATGTGRADSSPLPGFGPWTVDVIGMRALGDPDAFLAHRPRHPARGPGSWACRRPPPPSRRARRRGARGGRTRSSTCGRRTSPDQLPPRISDFKQMRHGFKRSGPNCETASVIDSPVRPPHPRRRGTLLCGLYMVGQRHRPPDETFGERDDRPSVRSPTS